MRTFGITLPDGKEYVVSVREITDTEKSVNNNMEEAEGSLVYPSDSNISTDEVEETEESVAEEDATEEVEETVEESKENSSEEAKKESAENTEKEED